MPFEDWLPGYEHVFKTGVFYVAESGGEVVGVCNGVVRGERFFFTGFWMLPGRQGEGVGGELIGKTWADALSRGAKEFFVWASIDWRALSTYMKLGMLPGCQIFTASMSAESYKRPSAQLTAGYSLEPLTYEVASQLDQYVLGIVREEDHRFWQEARQAVATAVSLNGETVGYCYSRKGIIGPVLFTDTVHGEALVHLAVEQALKDSEKAVIYLPGANRTAIAALVKNGLKLLSPSHFLTTKEFGRMELYLPSGPLLY